MTKGFKEYLQNTKTEFVTAVYELNLSPAQRVPMENMILAFDQCRYKLENRPNDYNIATNEKMWYDVNKNAMPEDGRGFWCIDHSEPKCEFQCGYCQENQPIVYEIK